VSDLSVWLRAAEVEARRRAALMQAEAVALAPWSLDRFCGGHAEQLEFVRDRSPWIHVMCARQSGKSRGALGLLLDNALSNPGSTNVFLGLTAKGVRTSQWFPAWQPLLEQYGITASSNETEMVTTFPNRARVIFGGTDDLRHVKTYLGNRLDGCVFILDEAQDQPDGVLRYILGTLLPPMLTPTSRVILSGVLPDVEVGYFYELAADRPLAETPLLKQSKGWSHHEWGRAANVHTPEAMEQLRVYMAQHGLTEDDPQIARDWFMRRRWRADATGYHYDRGRNGYYPRVPEWLGAERAKLEALGVPIDSLMAAEPNEGVLLVSAAIDPGGRDRTSLEVTGWGPRSRKVQHLFEWSTPRNSLAQLSHVGLLYDIVQQHYSPAWWQWDAPGKLEIDTFGRDHGAPTIKAANKVDMPGQVRRCNDLLEQARFDVMIGSALEVDYQRSVWDKDARAKGMWRWASAWHPDPAESARYTLSPYWDSFETRDPRTRTEREREAFMSDGPEDADKLPPDPLSEALGWSQ
jgi:hypothetical protein